MRALLHALGVGHIVEIDDPTLHRHAYLLYEHLNDLAGVLVLPPGLDEPEELRRLDLAVTHWQALLQRYRPPTDLPVRGLHLRHPGPDRQQWPENS